MSSLNIKKIVVNPELFTTKTRKNRASKPKPIAVAAIADTTDEFQQSMDYMTNLTKPKQKNRRTLRQPHCAATVVETVLPPELEEIPPVAEDPPYGCLKGGVKPSYREWTRRNRLQQNLINVVEPAVTLPELEPKEAVASVAPKTVDSVIQDYKKEHLKDVDLNKHYVKHSIHKKFALGKIPGCNKVSVSIKNGKTRKNVLNAQKQLLKTDVKDMRKYLIEHGILQTGSTCPNEILRKTFENSVLAGEVTNVNKEALIHNYLSE